MFGHLLPPIIHIVSTEIPRLSTANCVRLSVCVRMGFCAHIKSINIHLRKLISTLRKVISETHLIPLSHLATLRHRRCWISVNKIQKLACSLLVNALLLLSHQTLIIQIGAGAFYTRCVRHARTSDVPLIL